MIDWAHLPITDWSQSLTLTRIRVKDCIVCGKPVPKNRYSLCSMACRIKQRTLRRPVTINCAHCGEEFSFVMNSASHCRRYCDNCQKKSRSRNTKHMREMMRTRRNFQADESSCPAAWNPAREFPDNIGSATEPSPITGSEYEAEIKAFLARGGKIQYLPVMPADSTGHDDHQVYLIGKYE